MTNPLTAVASQRKGKGLVEADDFLLFFKKLLPWRGTRVAIASECGEGENIRLAQFQPQEAFFFFFCLDDEEI